MRIKTLFFSWTLLSLSLSTVLNGAERLPNVLIIVADDLGFSDLGCYGGEIATPALDGLASRGLRYTQFYNTARCWPTRSALLTGFYPQQIGRDSAPGVEGGNWGKRPEWARLLPEYLKAAGYRSYHSGKWHVDSTPVKAGFDHSYYLSDQDRFYSPRFHSEDDEKLPAVERDSGYYSTIRIADRAIEYLKDHERTFNEQPFFAYVAFTAPHFPLHALPEDIERVGDRYAVGWEQIRQQRWERINNLRIVDGQLSEVERELGPPAIRPESYKILGDAEVTKPVTWDSLNEKQKRFQQTKMTLHAAMVERMDMEIGRIVQQLRNMHVLENTLIVFLSDNGASAEILVRGDGHAPDAPPGSADSYLCLGPGWSTVCNTPFRRHKVWVHEGGAHTPLIVHWPNGIAARGALRHDPGHVIDLFPTVLNLAGINEPDRLPVPLPGQSLAPTFARDLGRERNLWWHHSGNRAMRMGDWKIVAAKNEDWELINLAKDPTESKDLSGDSPEKLRQLEQEWHTILGDFLEVAPKQTPPKRRQR